jgi:serine/threonine-protein kinase
MERPAPSIGEITSPALDRALQQCLKKDPDDRWQSARDLKAELEWIANKSGEVSAVPTATTRQRLLRWILAAGLLSIVAAGFAFGYYRAMRPAELKPLVRFDVDLGPDVSLGSGSGTDAILSPDGTRLVYVSKGKLFTRKLDQPKATELAGTEGAYAPFFSSDGQWVAFFVGSDPSKLKKTSVEGAHRYYCATLACHPGEAGARMATSSRQSALLCRGFPRAGARPPR